MADYHKVGELAYYEISQIRRYARIVSSLVLMFLLTGCAFHSPMSEFLMFNKKKVKGKVYRAKYSQSIVSLNYEITSTAAIRNMFIKIYPLMRLGRYITMESSIQTGYFLILNKIMSHFH